MILGHEVLYSKRNAPVASTVAPPFVVLTFGTCPVMFQYAIRYSPRIEYGLFSCPVGTCQDALILMPASIVVPSYKGPTLELEVLAISIHPLLHAPMSSHHAAILSG